MEVQFVQPRSDVSISKSNSADILVYSQNGLWLIHASENCWESAMCNFDLYLTLTCTINYFKSKETV